MDSQQPKQTGSARLIFEAVHWDGEDFQHLNNIKNHQSDSPVAFL